MHLASATSSQTLAHTISLGMPKAPDAAPGAFFFAIRYFPPMPHTDEDGVSFVMETNMDAYATNRNHRWVFGPRLVRTLRDESRFPVEIVLDFPDKTWVRWTINSRQDLLTYEALFNSWERKFWVDWSRSRR